MSGLSASVFVVFVCAESAVFLLGYLWAMSRGEKKVAAAFASGYDEGVASVPPRSLRPSVTKQARVDKARTSQATADHDRDESRWDTATITIVPTKTVSSSTDILGQVSWAAAPDTPTPASPAPTPTPTPVPLPPSSPPESHAEDSIAPSSPVEALDPPARPIARVIPPEVAAAKYGAPEPPPESRQLPNGQWTFEEESPPEQESTQPMKKVAGVDPDEVFANPYEGRHRK